jgi:lipopolysaccharide transport system ATP-binding protein
MSDVVIRAESVSKRYTIGHAAAKERYTTMRDVLARKVRSAARHVSDLVRGRAIIKGDELEDFWALRDVSFEIPTGEIVGIIGRNGAGKSTLLKILSRITAPSTGRVTIDGRLASLLEVGTGFHPELSGRENIFLNGAILGMRQREIKRVFDEIVAFAEVERFLDTPVKRYSSGMYVRLAFAVAGHLDPDILVIDEVLAVGDEAFQRRCLGKMKEVTSAGRTVLFVSHNLGAVSSLCKTGIHLEAGEIKAIGPAKRIVSQYLGELMKSGSNDLSKLRPAGLGEKVRFTDIRLGRYADGNVPYGMPLPIQLTIAADTRVKDLTLGAVIFAENATAVGGVASEKTFSIDAGGQITIDFELDHSNLAPGRYYAGFGVGTGGVNGPRTDLDYIAGIPYFHVVAGTNTNYLVANWHSSYGGVIFPPPRLKICARMTKDSNMNALAAALG